MLGFAVYVVSGPHNPNNLSLYLLFSLFGVLTKILFYVDTLIWPNCRLVVRHVAAITKKFASSIAPHITTILVHGKQVMSSKRWTEDSACLLPVSWLASCLA